MGCEVLVPSHYQAIDIIRSLISEVLMPTSVLVAFVAFVFLGKARYQFLKAGVTLLQEVWKKFHLGTKSNQGPSDWKANVLYVYFFALSYKNYSRSKKKYCNCGIHHFIFFKIHFIYQFNLLRTTSLTCSTAWLEITCMWTQASLSENTGVNYGNI